MIAVERVPREHGEHRLGIELFAPEQIFRQAKTVGRAIAPAAHVARTLVRRPDVWSATGSELLFAFREGVRAD